MSGKTKDKGQKNNTYEQRHKTFGPRCLRRSVAKANIERLGTSPHDTNFKGIWRTMAAVPSNEEIADCRRQREKDAKRRRKARAKATA